MFLVGLIMLAISIGVGVGTYEAAAPGGIFVVPFGLGISGLILMCKSLFSIGDNDGEAGAERERERERERALLDPNSETIFIGNEVKWLDAYQYGYADSNVPFVVERWKVINPPVSVGETQPSYREYIISRGYGDDKRTFGYIKEDRLVKIKKEANNG